MKQRTDELKATDYAQREEGKVKCLVYGCDQPGIADPDITRILSDMFAFCSLHIETSRNNLLAAQQNLSSAVENFV